MGAIFISHSSRNSEEAVSVRDWLRAEGYAETFLDLDPEHGLAPGQRWEEELQKAGERCLAVVVLVSPDWCASKWCFHEFKFAKALGKKIFPVLIQPTPWSELPLWLPSTEPDYAGFMRVSLARAEAAGLRTRPLRETVAAVLDEGLPAADDKRRAGKLTREREAQLLAAWSARTVV